MTVRELIEILKTLDPDAPLVVHGFLGGLDDLDALVPVALVENVYKSETWRGAHESLDTIKRYGDKAISSRTMSSDLRRHVQAVDGGIEAMPIVKAICLEGKSSAQTVSDTEEFSQDDAMQDKHATNTGVTTVTDLKSGADHFPSDSIGHADNNATVKGEIDMNSSGLIKPNVHAIMRNRRSADAV